MKTYEITIPIAGHVSVTVEADSEDEAKEKAFDSLGDDSEVQWEGLERFTSGNVCHCPSPWQVVIECVSEDEAA